LSTQIRNSVGQRFGVELAIRQKTAPEVLPTGISNIDIPRGTLTEICGPPSSGRTSIFNAALARATCNPEFCALSDAGSSFHPRSAMNAGVQLAHLLWVRCGGSAEKALKAADLVIQGGGFGVVVLDLVGVAPHDARRISLAPWFRLRHAVEKTPPALILVGEERYAASCATLQIEIRSAGFQITEDLLQGLTVEAVIGPRNPAKSHFAPSEARQYADHAFFGSLYIKHAEPFRKESELRALASNGRYKYGIDIPVNLSVLLERIVLSPEMRSWAVPAVTEAIRRVAKFDITCPIEPSSITG
jgi:recombination protein RecA